MSERSGKSPGAAVRVPTSPPGTTSASEPPATSPGAAVTPRPKPLVFKLLRAVLVIVAGAFVLWAGLDLARDFRPSAVRFQWGFALLSLLPILGAALLQGSGWIALIDRMGHTSVPRRYAMALYLESQMARYTPGKVGLPLVRMAGAPRLGVPAPLVGTSVLVELLSWLSVGGAVGFAALWWFSDNLRGVLGLMGDWSPPLVAAFGLGAIALSVLDRRLYPRFVKKLLRLEGHGPILPLSMLGYHALYWALGALHGYLASRAVGAGSPAALGSAGLFVLAPIAGFLALAAPAGLGVREAVLSVGLAPSVGSTAAVAAAVLSRGVSLLSDTSTWLWARWVARRSA